MSNVARGVGGDLGPVQLEGAGRKNAKAGAIREVSVEGCSQEFDAEGNLISQTGDCDRPPGGGNDQAAPAPAPAPSDDGVAPLVQFAPGFPFEDYGLVVTTSELPGDFDFTVVVEQTPSGAEITTSGF